MLTSFQEKILSHYLLNQESYLQLLEAPSFSSIPTLDNNKNAKAIQARLAKAKVEKEKVLIYGDYDCDGIMATSILYYCLNELKIPSSFFIPSRYVDSYGLTLENAKKIAEKGFQLLICVDNGIAANEPISYLKDKGIDVIVIDHHQIQEKLPDTEFIIHPYVCQYGEVEVSAGYLSFVLSHLLLGCYDPYLCVLGATSILSDMMPMRAHNRELVRLGLNYINEKHYPQFYDGKAISYLDWSMSIIPEINAIGRVEEDHSANRLVYYFALPYSSNSIAIKEWMSQVNTNRKLETKKANEEIHIDPNKNGILVVSHLKEGLNGLLANRLMNEYDKISIVCSPKADHPEILVGSMRALPPFSIPEFFEKNKDLLLTSGGHILAGGLSLKASDLPTFEARFQKELEGFKPSSQNEEFIPLKGIEATLENAKFIETLAPFGESWNEPNFYLENVNVSRLKYTYNGGYLSTPLKDGARLFSFQLKKEDLLPYETVSLKGKLRVQRYQRKETAEVLVEKILK